MVRDENFVVELVCSYMNSTTYQKFFVHDRVPLRVKKLRLCAKLILR